MAVDTSAVTIRVNVIDPTSGQVIQNVTGNLDKLGQAGTRAGAQVRKGMEEAGVGSLSAVEKMRLVTEEAGVRLPRAMIRLAAESKLASQAISAVGARWSGIRCGTDRLHDVHAVHRGRGEIVAQRARRQRRREGLPGRSRKGKTAGLRQHAFDRDHEAADRRSDARIT